MCHLKYDDCDFNRTQDIIVVVSTLRFTIFSTPPVDTLECALVCRMSFMGFIGLKANVIDKLNLAASNLQSFARMSERKSRSSETDTKWNSLSICGLN